MLIIHLLCTNTMLKLYEFIQREIHVPLLHIADATVDEVLQKNMNKIGLLGTKQTMELDFYKSRLEHKGIEVLLPKDNSMLLDMFTNANYLDTNNVEIVLIRIVINCI